MKAWDAVLAKIMNYRKDIDGLRSIAVTLVVLHHAKFSFVPGGYVGVDVFFVISGFLITGIIYQKVIRNEFSFSEFYIRRIRRLMPALFAVMFTTSVFALLFLFPSDLVRFGWSLVWVAIYLGNFFFWREHGGYFAENTQEAPLLHTWSLAVEEQYYIIWPLYVILGLRFLGFKFFSIITIVGFVFAIYLSEWATQNTIGAAYYLLPTRFFELMIGSILAIYWDRIKQVGPKIVNDLVSLIGIALICGSAIILTPSSAFPGFNALYPALGSALLIYSGKAEYGLVNRLLSLRPFVFIGLISYSLYLWHWPIFAFLTYTAVEYSLLLRVFAVTLSVVLAYLSWRFVETPFRRNSDESLGRVSFKLIAKPMFVVILIASSTILLEGIENRFNDDIVLMDKALSARPNVIRSECHSPSRDYALLPSENCILGAPARSGKADGFLIGDSHGNHLTGFIEVLAEDAGHSVQDYTMDQCPPIFDFAWGRTRQVANSCLQRNQLAREHLQKGEFKYVVMSASWPSQNSSRLFLEGNRILDSDERLNIIKDRLRSTLAEIIELGAIPILFDDVPSVINEDPRCPIKKRAFSPDRICKTVRVDNMVIINIFTELASEFPSIVRVSPGDLYCNESTCELVINNIPIFHDADHLNMLSSRELGIQYMNRYANPLKLVSSLDED